MVSLNIGVSFEKNQMIWFFNGEQIAPINMFRKQSNTLAKDQRRLKNKKKFSYNWKKQTLKIRRIHKKRQILEKIFNLSFQLIYAKPRYGSR